MQNIFFYLPLPAQFAWKPAEEDMVSNKANPLGKHVETPSLEINASSENLLIDFTNRLRFFYPGSSRLTSAGGHTVTEWRPRETQKSLLTGWEHRNVD